MPLILAIEPDRQQAAQLASIAKGRIGAELVLAESAERALREVGDRIPDLILTPQLLSPRDDAAITNRLRQLGNAAAYVQTLTIPSLATHQPSGQARAKGLLSKLRRQKAAPAEGPGGCAPDVFADQIAVYLERALEARTAQAAAEPPPMQVESQPVAPIEAATAILDQFIRPVAEPLPLMTPALESSAPMASVEAEPVVQEDPVVQAEPVAETPLYIDLAPAPVVEDSGARQPDVARASDALFRPRARAAEPDNSGFRLQPEEKRPSEPLLPPEGGSHAKAAKPVANPAPKKKARPVPPKNDWNFFNPDETRFAALLARLDEITRHDVAQHAQRPQA